MPTVAQAATKGRLAAPSDAVTTYPDLTGTATVLTFDPATVAALKAAGVTVGPTGAATAVAGGAGVSLPITSGYAEVHANRSFKPGYLLGSIQSFGSGLALATTTTSVALTDLVFDLGEAMVYGTIGATQDVPLFSISRPGLTVTRSGRTLQIDDSAIDLTPTGATELDALFHTTAITAHSALGTVAITARGRVGRYAYTTTTAEFPRLSGISTSVTFGPSARSLFHRVGVTPSPNGSATYNSGDSRISFPITGGTAVVHPNRKGKPISMQGVALQQGSGLVFSRGTTSVSMTDFTVKPGASAVYASVNGGPDDADLFTIDSSRSQLAVTGGNLHVDGATLALTVGAAAMLNSVFATTDFKAGAELGAMSVLASGG